MISIGALGEMRDTLAIITERVAMARQLNADGLNYAVPYVLNEIDDAARVLGVLIAREEPPAAVIPDEIKEQYPLLKWTPGGPLVLKKEGEVTI